MSKKPEFIDYSHEVKLVASRPLRYGLIALSWVFISLGLLGAILPLLPTTPFLILASICYAKSSPKFYNWLMNHPVCGTDLRQWTVSGIIRRKTKLLAITLMAISMTPTIVFLIPLVSVKLLLTAIGVSVALFIATRPETTEKVPN